MTETLMVMNMMTTVIIKFILYIFTPLLITNKIELNNLQPMYSILFTLEDFDNL